MLEKLQSPLTAGCYSGHKQTCLCYPKEMYLFPSSPYKLRQFPAALWQSRASTVWAQWYQHPQVYQAEQKLFQELSSATHDLGEGRYVTGIHQAAGWSVDLVVEAILVMGFNPRLKLFFFPFLSCLSGQGNLCTGRIQRGTKEGKTSSSQKRRKNPKVAVSICYKRGGKNILL